MFRCKECGTEYEIKPEYCDCGNDTFEEIIQENSIEQKSMNTNNLSSNEQKQSSKFENDIKSGANAEPKIAPCKPNPKKQNLSEQYSEASRFMHSIDPISLVIFCVCIILSFYVVFFAWNPSEEEVEQIKKAETNVTKKIPSIESFWNNTPPKNIEKPQIKQKENKSNEAVTNVVKQILPTVKPTEQKKTITPVKKAPVTKKTYATTKISKTTSVAKPKSAVQTQVQSQTQKISDEAAKKQAALDAERKAAEAAQLRKLQEERAKKAAEQKAKQSAQAKQEFHNYKAQLRNTIGRKVDFTRVIGDGSCTVSFKIDSSGKLTNRSFTKQSSNNTLNDAVYAAVMATPTFTPPPSYYNNETLNLTIRFYNGNFEISLP